VDLLVVLDVGILLLVEDLDVGILLLVEDLDVDAGAELVVLQKLP
jgi:hypothetical protein